MKKMLFLLSAALSFSSYKKAMSVESLGQSFRASSLNQHGNGVWSIHEGDRGLPITYEMEYTSSGEHPYIRIINVNKYKSGYVLIEMFGATNEIAKNMKEFIAPRLKKTELDLFYSKLTFEVWHPTEERMNELRELMQTLGREYLIPKEIVDHIDSQLGQITNVYSRYCFYTPEKGSVTENKPDSEPSCGSKIALDFQIAT